MRSVRGERRLSTENGCHIEVIRSGGSAAAAPAIGVAADPEVADYSLLCGVFRSAGFRPNALSSISVLRQREQQVLSAPNDGGRSEAPPNIHSTSNECNGFFCGARARRLHVETDTINQDIPNRDGEDVDRCWIDKRQTTGPCKPLIYRHNRPRTTSQNIEIHSYRSIMHERGWIRLSWSIYIKQDVTLSIWINGTSL